MRKISGSCYAIREQIKALGGEWDEGAGAWFVPDDAFPAAQGLADAENFRQWQEYAAGLAWCEGGLTEAAWDAALRAASLCLPFATAMHEISGRVRCVKASVPDGWFSRNVGRAYEQAGQSAGGEWKAASVRELKKKIQFVPAALAKAGVRPAGEVGIRWLCDRSPVSVPECTAGDFLRALYQPGECVVIFDVFESQGQWMFERESGFVPCAVAHSELYREGVPPLSRTGEQRWFCNSAKGGLWFLANPVSGDWLWFAAATGKPHWSRRFTDCVTSWRFMVVESDVADSGQWLAALVELPLAIAAIYTSGGKSIHALVKLNAGSLEEWNRARAAMLETLVSLGADRGALSAVRLTRLPGCFREGKFDGDEWQPFPRPKPQRLLFLDPSPSMRPISTRPKLRDALAAALQSADTLLALAPEARPAELLRDAKRGLEYFAGAEGVAERWALL